MTQQPMDVVSCVPSCNSLPGVHKMSAEVRNKKSPAKTNFIAIMFVVQRENSTNDGMKQPVWVRNKSGQISLNGSSGCQLDFLHHPLCGDERHHCLQRK